MGIKKDFPSYEEAQRRVVAAGIKSRAEFREFDKKSIGIPSHPDRVYRNKGWISFGVFCRNGWPANRKDFLTYEQAREYVRTLNITSRYDYRLWEKTSRPDNIPSGPQSYYYHEFKGWWDYLGCPCQRQDKIPFQPPRPDPYIPPLMAGKFNKAVISLFNNPSGGKEFSDALDELLKIGKTLEEYTKRKA